MSQFHDRFLPPVAMFPIADELMSDPLAFARFHLTDNTDWSRTSFSAENCFIPLEDHR
jgi:hypothetical protein